MRKLLILTAVLLLAARAGADEPGLVRQGPWTAYCDFQGGWGLLKSGTLVLYGLGVECGWHEYTTFRDLTGRQVEKGENTLKMTGTLPGSDIRFTQTAAVEDGRLHIRLTRQGPWPADMVWGNLQFRVPRSVFGKCAFLVDGVRKDLPAKPDQDSVFFQGFRKLSSCPDGPGPKITVESGQSMSLGDLSRWGDSAFRLSIPLPRQNDQAALDLWIDLSGSMDFAVPAVRFSRIGYSAAGFKQAVLEWDLGAPRPDDTVRVERKDGKIVLQGNFGKTVEFMNLKCAAAFDLSGLTEPGEYRLVWSQGTTPWFPVKARVFDQAWVPSLDVWIPWQMCHAAVDVGPSAPAHPASYMDDGIRVPSNFPGVDGFRSYGCEGTPYRAGDPIPCTVGGWYDAGDNDLNVDAQAYTVWMLSLAYDEFKVDRDIAALDIKAQTYTTGKPDGVPDLLQQVQWGVLWLLSMQQKDGRVYAGVQDQPKNYGASKAPETMTDNKPGTGDERHVYVDYHPDVQLKAAVGLASAARALKKADPALSAQCLAGARAALACFERNKEEYRNTTYFTVNPRNKGRNGMVLNAWAELYLTTKDAVYLKKIEAMTGKIEAMEMTWPSPFQTWSGDFWFSGSSMARLAMIVPDGRLKTALLGRCSKAAQNLSWYMLSDPWPLQRRDFHQFGNATYAVARIFDAYWLSKVVPKDISVERSLTGAYWIFGLHPLNDLAFVSGFGAESPRYLYSSQLHARRDTGPTSVPGALFFGLGGDEGAGVMLYQDEPNQYVYSETCIYSTAQYVFDMLALTAAGY